jgi:DNA polymerase-3 subunit delta'
VAIVDAADDLNVNAANAILKTLEEPPPRGVLLMVSHSPGRLLPTIRSRCRRLAFQPLGVEPTAEFVLARADANPEEALRLATMAEGAPGRALQLAAGQALAMDDAARDLLADLPQVDEAARCRSPRSSAAAEGAAQFALLFERLAERVHALAADRPRRGSAA